MPWRALLARALNASDLNRFLGANRADADAVWLEDEDVIRALRTVAGSLHQQTLTPWGYDQGLHELGKRRRRSRHHTPIWLPSSLQVVGYCGTWAAALRLAGLKPTRGPGMRNGLAVIDALDLCISAHGALPSQRELAAFATAQRIAVARRNGTWAECVAQVRMKRAARGENTPAALPRRDPRRPDYTHVFEHIANDPTLPRKVKKRWSEPECIEWLIRFITELPPGRSPSYNAYKGFSERHPDAPWPRSFERYGGFTVLREKAQRELRRRQRAA